MVIVVTGADASENNIGQIEGLPIVWDADASNAKDHIPIAAATFNYAKNRGFNEFFKGLKSGGIWTNITCLTLPIFGQSEGGVNLKTPTQNIGLPSSGTVATYNANGVQFLQGWASPISVSTTSFHGGVYNTTANTDNSGSRVGLTVGNGGRWISARRSGSNGSGASIDANYQAIVANRVGGVGLVMSSYNSSTKRVATIVDGEYVGNTRTETPPAISSGVVWLGGTAAGATTFLLQSPIGLITMGAELTQTQMTVYDGLCHTLLTTLMA